MKLLTSLKRAFVFALFFASLELAAQQNPNPIWNSLSEANSKFVNSPNYAAQRDKWVNTQKPPCIVLSCADSRVTPEMIFQQDIGQLFVVRVAGQVVDDVVIDSIEFAVGQFGSSLIVVLGHTNCGAVAGALDHLKRNNGAIDIPHGHLNAVLIPIEKAIVQSGININAPNALELATRANVAYIAKQLTSQSKRIADAVAQGKLKIVGAEYSLKTGEAVKLFEVK